MAMADQTIIDSTSRQAGCFVYHVLENVALRNVPHTGDEYRAEHISFEPGNLVSVDLIVSVSGENGPFLRLSDHSGWLFEKKGSCVVMEQVPVESGLWCFYVDNFPFGQTLRRHPMDNPSNIDVKTVPTKTYLPMEKVYFDRKVYHPTNAGVFYRAQGTHGWMFPKRRLENSFSPMMLNDTAVEEGLFVYKVVAPLAVRSDTFVSDDSKTSTSVKEGSLVAADVRRQSPFGTQNGPFLRLTGGLGWLFEKKYGETVMKPMKVQKGYWALEVVRRIALRYQPIDCKRMRTDTEYAIGQTLGCDYRVADGQTYFYRVADTNGWVFDRRGETTMLELLVGRSPPSKVMKSAHMAGWSPDFVRGVAGTVEDVSEISFNERSRVISFLAADRSRVNVYYTTQTVGVALNNGDGATQVFHRNCSTSELRKILQDPDYHTGRGYQMTSASKDVTEYGCGFVVDGEDELRHETMALDRQIGQLKRRRTESLLRLRTFETERSQQASSRSEEFKGWVLFRETERMAAEELREAAERAERARIDLHNRTCPDCGRVFHNAHARYQHYEAVHVFRCEYCGRQCNSLRSLNQHRDALSHW